jgi:hypothetical protein
VPQRKQGAWRAHQSVRARGAGAGRRRQALGFRMLRLLALPIEAMDRAALQSALEPIARS